MRTYVLDLAERFSIGVYDVPFLRSAVLELYRQGRTWPEVVRIIADVELERLHSGSGAEEWTVWLTLAPYAMGDPLKSKFNADRLDSYLDQLAELYEYALALWQREMAPGLRARDMAEALSAAADGFTLHKRIDNVDRVTEPRPGYQAQESSDDSVWTVWSIAVLGIVDAMTRAAPQSSRPPQPSDAVRRSI